MREATGELNITVIVVILVAAIAALFGLFVFPQMKEYVEDDASCSDAICNCISDCRDEAKNGVINCTSKNGGPVFRCPFKG